MTDEHSWLCPPHYFPGTVKIAEVPSSNAYAKLDRPHKHWSRPAYLARAVMLVGDVARAVPISKVLDVGCGCGQLWPLLRPVLAPSTKYLGVDCSSVVLALARQTHPEQMFCQASAEVLPLPNKSVDVAVCWDVLIHLEDMLPALRELCRVARQRVILRLRTGGPGRKDNLIYDPVRCRLFKQFGTEYAYFNILTVPGLRAFLAAGGVNDPSFDRVAPSDGGCCKTAVWFTPS